jgi:4-amino-4-deoxy-L-arabinose transferase-like glycosyltransferase
MKNGNNLTDHPGTPPWVGRSFVAILLLATFVRLWGIDYGLPYEGITYDQVTYEESQEVHRAFKLGAGEYAWTFGKGGLYFLLFFEYGIFYVVSLLLGWVNDSREFAVQVLQDRTATYMMGRLTNMVLGLLTYVVIFVLGKQLYGWRTGLVAALLGTFGYYHAVFSTVINVDIGMVLFLWASILAYVVYERNRELKYLIGAGILGGIAIAFKLPAAILLPLICAAILTASANRWIPQQIVRQGAIYVVSLLVTLSVVAPEWIGGVGNIVKGGLFGLIPTAAAAESAPQALDDTIRSVSILRHGSALGYIKQLFNSYNGALTILALAGMAIGILRKNRWDVVWAVFAVAFVVAMSAADRSQSEHYLLPVMPALWLLAARAVVAVYERNQYAGFAAIVFVVAMPTIALARQMVEKSHPDTRIVAKNWIESNIDSGAKILMDGMQFRFIPSPPLNPNEIAIARQVERASAKGGRMGRGVSELTLEIYEEALTSLEGPSYNLYSTTHGVGLKSPAYYVENCFDYVITSSYITNRYAPGRARREIVPQAARFYDALSTDSSFRELHRVEPRRWNSIGPTITIYEVMSDCDAASAG